jgi:hypothetical protein
MYPRLGTLVESFQNTYRSLGIYFDESYMSEVEQYYNLISTSPKTQALKESDRIFVIAVVSEEAVKIAHARHINIINSSVFKSALLEYKGPIRDPDDKCEDAALRIYKNKKLYRSKLSKEIMRLFQGM